MNNNFCYIHIPFCTSKCKYCKFASFWNLDSKKLDLYINFLLEEIKKSKIDFKLLKSIYFGWWTPSVLSINILEKIINILKLKYKFDKNIEITLEATPVTVTKENIYWWKSIGINRLSIWVQTLNNESLIEIWRGEKGDVINALNIINEVSFANVNVDFIIWLPLVKKWEVKKDIEYILNKYDFVKHLSVYILEEFYYPWNWNNISINNDEYLEEYIEVSNLLKIRWFKKYEISNYALPWYECKHNKAYWSHSNVLAFWLWAHWFVNNTRYANSGSFIDYYSGKQEIEEMQTISDLFLEKVMFQLRTEWLTKDIYEKLDQNKINYFLEEKYLEKKSDKIILSDKWVLILDYILGEIV